MNKIGVYIHIPFCLRKCLYCDFNSYDHLQELQEEYVQALLDQGRKAGVGQAETAFVGGGTPTCLDIGLLEQVVAMVQAEEYSVECNPATGGRDYFARLIGAGANRLSIGLQSAQEDELRRLGRLHSYGDFEKTFWQAREAGFENINVDLMFGLPGQTLGSWKDTLARTAALGAEHISCYSLIIEEGTPFYSMDLELPDEETERELYRYAVHFLQEQGYERYEISNFAKAGYQCRHNLKYWRREPYLGLGAGAHSLMNDVRYENPRAVDRYIAGEPPEKTVLTPQDVQEEYVFLALRTAEGIDLEDYKKCFGADLIEKKRDKIELYQKLGLLRQEGGRLFLTLEGISVSNTIMSELM